MGPKLFVFGKSAAGQPVVLLSLAAGSPHKGEITAQIPGAGPTRLRLDCLARFQAREIAHPQRLTPPTRDGLREAHAELVRAASRSSAAAIPVKRAGKGPSDRSIKVTVQGVGYDDRTIPHSHELPARDRTLTVPRSQLREVDGQLYAPVWLLRSTIKKRLEFWPALPAGQWPEAEAAWRETFEPLIPLVDEWAAGEAMKKLWLADRRKKREAEDAAREAARQAKLAAAREAEEAAKARRAVKHAERLTTLPTIRTKAVRWREWVKTGNYKNRSGYYVEVEHENATLRISGRRAYVLLEDGEEIIKSVGSIQWEPTST